MSVGIATMGMYDHPTGPATGPEDLGSDPIAHGGGLMPGAYSIPKRKRLKILVRNVNTINENAEIKVQIT